LKKKQLLHIVDLGLKNKNMHEIILNTLGGAFLFIKREQIKTYSEAYEVIKAAYNQANISSSRFQTNVEYKTK